MIVEVSPKLYRYDLEEPPIQWSTNFFSIEPNYNDPVLGHKNKAGLFFFIDSLNSAKELGCIAGRREKKEKYYLTELSKFSIPLKLIDFKDNDNIYHMLCNLTDMGINVLTDNFKTYKINEQSFSDYRLFFEHAELETDSNNKRRLIDQLRIGTLSVEAIGIFGQRLTDFDNGLAFKSLIKSLDPSIDGYRWRENREGLTYCLFDSKKLPGKKCDIISI